MKERRFRHVCDHVLHCVDIEGKLSIELDPTMVDSFVDFDSRNSRTPYLVRKQLFLFCFVFCFFVFVFQHDDQLCLPLCRVLADILLSLYVN